MGRTPEPAKEDAALLTWCIDWVSPLAALRHLVNLLAGDDAEATGMTLRH